MTTIDVADLQREDLPSVAFPVAPREDFRFYMSPEVYRGIEAHAKADPSVEICGVLVGQWGRDDHGPFALAQDYIRSTSAASKFAEVTFTHESWGEINREMDTKYADKRIVGWYHSHPDFGIFLSERDCFIHEHFFSGAGQVAYVIDPVRDLEGVFSWQQGKPAPMSHFWVGPAIHTVQASQRSEPRDGGGGVSNAAAVAQATDDPGPATSPLSSPLTLPTTLLAWMCLFLLGYGCAGWRSRTEMQLLAEGAVAHYGMKVTNLELEADITRVRQALAAVEAELAKLPQSSEKLTTEEAATANKRRQVVGDSLKVVGQALQRIQEKYALSPEQRDAYLRLFADKQAAVDKLFRQQDEARRIGESIAPTKSEPKTDSAAQSSSSPPKAKPNKQQPD